MNYQDHLVKLLTDLQYQVAEIEENLARFAVAMTPSRHDWHGLHLVECDCEPFAITRTLDGDLKLIATPRSIASAWPRYSSQTRVDTDEILRLLVETSA